MTTQQLIDELRAAGFDVRDSEIFAESATVGARVGTYTIVATRTGYDIYSGSPPDGWAFECYCPTFRSVVRYLNGHD